MKIHQETHATFSKNASFLKKIFPQDDEKYYYGFLNHDPLFSPRTIFSMKNQEQIVATLWYLPRLFLDGERILTAAGIANVATDPEFRGQGLAARLMERALKEAEIQPADFLILVTEIPKYYEKWGFQEMGKYHAIIKPEHSTNRASIEPVAHKNILDIYEAFYRHFHLIVPFRNMAYMTGMMEWNQWSLLFNTHEEKSKWWQFIVDSGDSVIVYGMDRGEHFEIFEILWGETTDTKRVVSILHGLAYQLGKEVYISLPLTIINILDLEIHKNPKNTVMVRAYRDIDLQRIYIPVPDYF